jgi:hypothetical protein
LSYLVYFRVIINSPQKVVEGLEEHLVPGTGAIVFTIAPTESPVELKDADIIVDIDLNLYIGGVKEVKVSVRLARNGPLIIGALDIDLHNLVFHLIVGGEKEEEVLIEDDVGLNLIFDRNKHWLRAAVNQKVSVRMKYLAGIVDFSISLSGFKIAKKIQLAKFLAS